MTRYVSRAPKSEDEDWFYDRGSLVPSLTVDDAKEVDTGLIDQQGNSIFRLQAPIGFGRDAEH